MHPRLRVQAGTSLSSMSDVRVNSTSSVQVNSDAFEGGVGVYLVDYLGPEGHEGVAQPPQGAMPSGCTMNLRIEGRFPGGRGDDIVFGNQWEHPIKQWLPYGTSAALKFAQTVVDPTLVTDLYADKPWALSPFLSTMNTISITDIPSSGNLPTFSTSTIAEDVSSLFTTLDSHEGANLSGNSSLRRKYFAKEANRKEIELDAGKLVKADFCNGFIDFNTLSLRLPIGLSFPLASYWDGQPVTFVLRNRSGSINYFFITFQIANNRDEVKQHVDSTASKEEEGEDGKDQDVHVKEGVQGLAEAAERDTLGVD